MKERIRKRERERDRERETERQRHALGIKHQKTLNFFFSFFRNQTKFWKKELVNEQLLFEFNLMKKVKERLHWKVDEFRRDSVFFAQRRHF